MPKGGNKGGKKPVVAVPVVKPVADALSALSAEVEEEIAVLNEIYPGDVTVTVNQDAWGKKYRTLTTCVSAGSENDFTRIEARVRECERARDVM
jgi:hypothetical protein